MTTEPLPGAPACLAAFLAEMENARAIYSDADLAAARRLVMHKAMRPFYTDAWTRQLRTDNQWRVWFDCSWHAATYPYANLRNERSEQIKAMERLGLALEGAVMAMEEVRDTSDGPLGLPLEFCDPLRLLASAAESSQRNGVGGRYMAHVAPTMGRLSMLDLRYFPDAVDLLARMSLSVTSWLRSASASGQYSYSHDQVAIRSRKASDVPEYVRWFDQRLADEGEWALLGCRLPDRLLARQCAVALDMTALINDEHSLLAFVDRVRKARTDVVE